MSREGQEGKSAENAAADKEFLVETVCYRAGPEEFRGHERIGSCAAFP